MSSTNDFRNARAVSTTLSLATTTSATLKQQKGTIPPKLLQDVLIEHPHLAPSLTNSSKIGVVLERIGGRSRKAIFVRMLRRHPLLLHCALEDCEALRTLAQQVLVDFSDCKNKDLEGLIQQRLWPVIGNQRRQTVRKWIRCLRHQGGLSMDQIYDLVHARPSLMYYSPEKLAAAVDFLQSQVLRSNKDYSLYKMIKAHPHLVGYSVQDRLRPTVDFIQSEVFGNGPARSSSSSSSWSSSWQRVLCKYPRIFGYSVEESLRPRLIFLQEKLSLRRADICRVVRGFPPTLWLSEENLLEKIALLLPLLGSKEELRNVVVTYPQMLGLAVEKNLEPKLEVLQRELGTLEAVREWIIYQPALLGYSLEGRIQPRIQQLHDASISLELAPLGLMSFSNEKFQEWLEIQVESWYVVE